MKITLNKNAKRVLSLVLAFAMLIGSLFAANVGVTFDASAETEGIVVEWDGSTAGSIADTESAGTIDDPIEIATPAELAYLAKGASNLSTDGKYYKIADGIKEFDMKNKTWAATSNATPFAGHFDGNGVVIKNLNGNQSVASALFACVNASNTNKAVSFKNIIIIDSAFYMGSSNYSNGAAAIVAWNSGGSYSNPGTITVENCVVKNTTFTSMGSAGSSVATAGLLCGNVQNANVTIKNCLLSGNTVTAAASVTSYGGLIGSASNFNISVNNIICIGSDPLAKGSSVAYNLKAASTYSNVYTDQTVDTNVYSSYNIKQLTTEQMKGTAATENMALDFGGTWFANTAGVPVLRAFHNISATDNDDGTHSEVCADCGLVGLTAKHLYNVIDYTTNTSSCICGAWEWGTNDVWDGTKASGFAGGTGTEADPYIIKTVEQLFLMVRSTGINADGTPVYYEVADSVNALYINDTRAFADQAAFEAAASSLKNWSTGLTTEAALCGDTANCYSEHYNDVYTSSSTQVLNNHRDGYVDYFGGRFNGNGVTIYGLYSKTTAANHWNNGTGFVPMLTGDAVIKNVTFDTNYVDTNSASAAVITATVGIWDGQYNKDTDGNGSYETFVMCPEVDAYAKRPENCNAAIINVAVTNSYLKATNYSNVSYVTGFVSSIRAPKSLKFDNCLFDGTNTTITDTGSTDMHYAFVVTQESNTNSTVTGCVSVAGSSTVAGLNSYTGANNAVVNCYELDSNEFTVEDTPLLNWLNWDVVDGKATLKNNDSWIADSYKNQGEYRLSWRKNKVLTSTDEYGTIYEYSAIRGNRGVFNDYNTLQGSGTEADPYIINDADTLYMIIASGGTHYGVPQYYKLGCNIDLEGKQWVDIDIFENTTYEVVFYDYKPFEGTLDGDGYTISGLYSAIASDEYACAGFIPQLAATGVVKNINFRNCYAYDASDGGGIITGDAADGSTIENCSLNNCVNEKYAGYAPDVNLNNCYVIKQDGSVEYSSGTPTLGEDWYGITGENATPIRSVSFAKKMPCADIDADGVGDEYTTNDVTALKSNLLWKDGYDYIYGDVTGNGTIDMRDLAMLQRQMTGQETIELDGFWPNVREGKFSIYYDEADNYDFARKLELYLETMTGVDVPKALGSSTANFTINIKTAGDVSAYSSSYDKANAKLTISGGSFTAVEEAVNYFIANTGLFDIPQDTSGTISTEKAAVTVDGSTYYYAWGDEFETAVDGTVSYDNWILRNKGTDDTPGTADTEFEYIRKATDDEAKGINLVQDGKLTLKRGFTGATSSTEHKFYMSGISSKDSMLFKQGYLEMVATVPSDGYSFPAWWLLTHDIGNGNITIDRSLYSKVYERNGVYDGTSTYATPTDVTSYKYKVPTQTLEMDLFEIIQRPTETWSWGSWSNVSAPSDDHNIKFNIHKWYTYSLDKNDNSLAVYDLDWANAPTSGAFPTQLLTASGATAGSGYTQNSASILVNSGNLSTGGVNGAVTYQGGHATMQYDMESLRNTSEQITSRKYGFLWTEDKMTFTVYTDAAGTSVLYTATVTKDQMNFGGSESYGNSDTFGFDQYAYMLIENHIFTAQKDGSSWIEAAYDDIGECDLVIDYVRLYQLDGARAIITPESESIHSR